MFVERYVLQLENADLAWHSCQSATDQIISAADSIMVTVSVGTRASAIIADLMVLLFTLRATMSTYRSAVQLGIRVPLVTMLVHDGKFATQLLSPGVPDRLRLSRYNLFSVSLMPAG